MNRAEALAKAQEWIRLWSARDVESIAAHYAPDARFVSPVAAHRTGDGLVVGRQALQSYWSGARRFETFAFTLDHVVWDEEQREMVIVYTREVDGKHDRACEFFRFDEDGQVVSGEAMYSVAP